MLQEIDIYTHRHTICIAHTPVSLSANIGCLKPHSAWGVSTAQPSVVPQFEFSRLGERRKIIGMEYKKPLDQLYDPHKKAQDAIDHAREVREQKIADRDKNKTEPRLIADGNVQRCSVCGYRFESDVQPSMSVAFADHLRKAHKRDSPTELF